MTQQMAMAVLLIFSAVAQQGHIALPGEPANQAEGELLPVILDGRVARVDAAAHEQLGSILPRKLRP